MKNLLPKESGIYEICNIVNGKSYIGSAVSLYSRWNAHICDLRHGRHHSQKLQRAWIKYGESSFVINIIELINDKLDLLRKEQEWINKYNCVHEGYNVAPVAGNCLGVKHSKETKYKHYLLRIGKKLSPETCAKMSIGRKGKNTGKRTPEHCAKISESLKGNHYALGYKHSEETRAKVSAAGMGRVFSKERNEKMAASKRGRKQTAEHIEKHAATLRGRKLPEDMKRRISESLIMFHANRKASLSGEMRCAGCLL
jgi:group I intron endonuclease